MSSFGYSSTPLLFSVEKLMTSIDGSVGDNAANTIVGTGNRQRITEHHHAPQNVQTVEVKLPVEKESDNSQMNERVYLTQDEMLQIRNVIGQIAKLNDVFGEIKHLDYAIVGDRYTGQVGLVSKVDRMQRRISILTVAVVILSITVIVEPFILLSILR